MTGCKRRLDYWRDRGNELRVALLEADMNEILERLQELYEGKTHE